MTNNDEKGTAYRYLQILSDFYILGTADVQTLSKMSLTGRLRSICIKFGIIETLHGEGAYRYASTEEPTLDLCIKIVRERRAQEKIKRDNDKKKKIKKTVLKMSKPRLTKVTEEEAIAALRDSKQYKYEIYRTLRVQAKKQIL